MTSYYDIDAILTDAQKVPCTFEISVPNLGYLTGNVGEDMKKGTKVELPLWLAEMLAVSQPAGAGSLATLDLPTALSQRVMNALKADPKTVDLRAQAQHFYNIGARMLELFEEEDMVEILTDTFKQRAAEIADQAHNSRSALGEGAEFTKGLDETERQLFRAAHDGSSATKRWFETANRT
ncbi:DNA replication protein [Zalaria obscura]|uniref:DNA replication protein n=1 Tax=Zalaria obscura TaxID=2024903 RepID=A0ACC3SJ18_9PEZI